MSNIIKIAYSVEGTTDKRLLESIIKNTFEYIAFECDSLIEVYEIINIAFPKGSFVAGVIQISEQAFQIGANVLCIHTDADAATDNIAFMHKINPSITAILQNNSIDICNNIVPIVPIHMSEAWMLADKRLIKEEINTNMTDQDLGIYRNPEDYPDPKSTIQEALRISQEHISRRRKKLTIDEIYQPIGQNLTIEKLNLLPSFQKFINSVRLAYRRLNYLH